MNKSLRRRVAAVATTATVGGLLLPFLAAGSAFAAAPPGPAPTVLTVNPSNAATNVGRAAIFNVTKNIGATGDMYVQGLAGPDMNVAPVKCAPTSPTTERCTFTPANGPGTDTVRFFYDANGSGAYQANDASTTANLTVAGPANQLLLAPASPASVAGSDYKKFTVTATDVAGRPVVNANLNITASEPKTARLDLYLVGPKPATDFEGGPVVTTALTMTTATRTAAQVTADGTAGTVPGVASFYVASKNPGTISLSVAANPVIPGLGATANLVVNGGTANDIKTVTLTPNAQRAFVGDRVTAVVNLQNAQGDPVAGIVPVVLLNGVPLAPPVNTTDGSGNTTVNYTAAATTGTDTLTAFVNQNKPLQLATPGLDAGEPSTDQVNPPTVTRIVADVTGITDNGGVSGFSVPLNVKTTTITYTVKTNGNTQAGYNVLFTSTAGVDTLSATSAVTDASGKVSVSVTNLNPSDGDKATVTAKIGSIVNANYKKDTNVVYSANASSATRSIKITPFANTAVAGGTASFTATATDPNGNPVAGVTFAWTVTGRNNGTNNTGATGTGPTFSYSDKGATNAAGQDIVTVQASGGALGFNSADQYWVTTAARATQANIDLVNNTGGVGPDGKYTQNNAGLPVGTFGPVLPSGFDTTVTSKVSPDPTALKPLVGNPQFVAVGLTDEQNNRLYGKTVTFSSTGVGVFTDFQGNPLGTSATALVADGNAHNQDFNFKGLDNGSNVDFATVYVRSTVPGKQLITATVDGVSTNATVTYTGQYIGVTPTRVVDTRTGQGALQVAGTTAPVGPLASNTSYTFNYAAAGMPLGAEAYAFNVTAIDPSGVGNLRVYPPTTGTVPTTSVVNYQPGKDVANFVIVPNDPAFNRVQLFSAASTADVTIDLVGYYPTIDSITSVVPSRIADTRNSGGGGPVAANTTRAFQVAGSGGIPGTGTVKAVALNVTTVNPGGLGNLRVFADGAAVPTTSNINYIAGQDKSAFVIVNLPTNGKIDVFSAGSAVDVAIDAYAFFDKPSTLVTQTPVRILDTRLTGNTIPASNFLDVPVAGVGGVPADASAVLVSVTGIHTTGSTGVGNLRAYPSSGVLPIVSTLNYVSPTADVANFAIVKLGANGSISIDSEGSPIDVAVDVVGYVPAGS